MGKVESIPQLKRDGYSSGGSIRLIASLPASVRISTASGAGGPNELELDWLASQLN